ncbi:hypothetical protein XENOCAPTIV_007155, partial [Xenoophorus captivus]
ELSPDRRNTTASSVHQPDRIYWRRTTSRAIKAPVITRILNQTPQFTPTFIPQHQTPRTHGATGVSHVMIYREEAAQTSSQADGLPESQLFTPSLPDNSSKL